jgi:arylsulfatase A-like enzyme
MKRRTLGLLVAALLVAFLFVPRKAPPPLPRSIVLVTIDTLRADHLGSYGYPRSSSPFLDRLAREGVVFENAQSSAVQTSAAHASIFTGLYPSQHGVRSNGQGFGDAASYEPLAETLRKAGYQTAAVSAVGFLAPMLRGFSAVDLARERRPRLYRQAHVVVNRALAWLAARAPQERVFLWVHLYEPHLPQRAPEACAAGLVFPSAEAKAEFARAIIEKHRIAPGFYTTAEELADAYAAYDAEIRFADRELERLFDAMTRSGRNDDSLWIVTADHGEGLGNHSYAGHGQLLYEEALRVPLLVYEKGQASRRIATLVRDVDILPTVLERAGLVSATTGYTLPGRSLLPLIAGASLPDAPAFAQRRPAGPKMPAWERGEVFSLRLGDWKYVVHTLGKDELFNLREDPFELRALEASSPQRDRLGHLARATFAAAEREGGALSPSAVDPRLSDELLALGYVGDNE